MTRDQDKNAFGERLRLLRKQRGMTQRDLAEKVACARGYVSSLETGSFSPSMRILKKLSQALAVELHELLFAHGLEDVCAVPILNSPDKSRLLAPGLSHVRGLNPGNVRTVLPVAIPIIPKLLRGRKRPMCLIWRE